MKVLKIIAAAVLTVVCLTVVAFTGFFLWSAIPRERPEPVVLTTDQLFQEQEPEAPETPSAEEPKVETPAVEEMPKEEPPKEEPPKEDPPAQEQPSLEAPPEEFPDPFLDQARAYLETMTLEEKLWQLFLVTPEGLTGQAPVTRASEWTEKALAERPVGGLVYFSDNLIERQQTVEMLTKTRSYAKTPLFLAVDEEGGPVSRLGANEAMGVPGFEAAAVYGEHEDTSGVYEMGGTLARELGALGFNLNFAPVADVVTNPNNTEIGSRAYSSDPAVAADLVSAMVRGLQEGNVASCLKHFPGHGSTEADSHQGTSVSDRTLEELRQTEWIPFRTGIESGAAFVMLSHLTNENLSPYPCSLSPEVVAYLRQDLGFEGIVITDSLQMGAILNNYTSAQAAVMAIYAGVDMLLMPNDVQVAYDALAAALDEGFLTEARIDESVLRILRTKYQFGIME